MIETATSPHLLHLVHYWVSDPAGRYRTNVDFFHTSLVSHMDGNVAVTRNSRYEIHFLDKRPDVPTYGQVMAMMLGADPTKVTEPLPGVYCIGILKN